MRYRNLAEFTKDTIIPERKQLSENEFRQLYAIVKEAPNGDGLFEALSLAYKAGFETGRK